MTPALPCFITFFVLKEATQRLEFGERNTIVMAKRSQDKMEIDDLEEQVRSLRKKIKKFMRMSTKNKDENQATTCATDTQSLADDKENGELKRMIYL